jgi:hypothetical protein
VGAERRAGVEGMAAEVEAGVLLGDFEGRLVGCKQTPRRVMPNVLGLEPVSCMELVPPLVVAALHLSLYHPHWVAGYGPAPLLLHPLGEVVVQRQVGKGHQGE